MLRQVRQMRDEYTRAGKTGWPLMIDAAKDVPWQDVVHVMDLCKREQIERIELRPPRRRSSSAGFAWDKEDNLSGSQEATKGRPASGGVMTSRGASSRRWFSWCLSVTVCDLLALSGSGFRLAVPVQRLRIRLRLRSPFPRPGIAGSDRHEDPLALTPAVRPDHGLHGRQFRAEASLWATRQFRWLVFVLIVSAAGDHGPRVRDPALARAAEARLPRACRDRRRFARSPTYGSGQGPLRRRFSRVFRTGPPPTRRTRATWIS